MQLLVSASRNEHTKDFISPHLDEYMNACRKTANYLRHGGLQSDINNPAMAAAHGVFCSTYTLSDPIDPDFQQPCPPGHDHAKDTVETLPVNIAQIENRFAWLRKAFRGACNAISIPIPSSIARRTEKTPYTIGTAQRNFSSNTSARRKSTDPTVNHDLIVQSLRSNLDPLVVASAVAFTQISNYGEELLKQEDCCYELLGNLVRARNQDVAFRKALDNLTMTQLMMICDYKMKVLPRKAYEPSGDFWGKFGNTIEGHFGLSAYNAKLPEQPEEHAARSI
jgi:hypothetical protein